MSIDSQSHSDYRFVLGLVAGTVVGAGLLLLFAPAPGHQVRQRIGGALDNLAEKGHRVRVRVADAMVDGAHEVEQFANAAIRARSREL